MRTRVPERAIGGMQLTRVLDQLAKTRGLPKAIRTDNGKEFCSRAMLTWAHARGVQLFLIEPGKPNQNAYIESFNGCFLDECLNEHWFSSLRHAQIVIEGWRREYNEERPKKSLRDNRIRPGLRLEREHICFHWLSHCLQHLDGTGRSNSAALPQD